MSLLVKKSEVVMRKKEGLSVVPLFSEMTYGTNASLMYASRPEGYHSNPHIHDCEQLNWIQEGSIWIFIQREGDKYDAYHAEPGDYLRIPPNRIHWAWNKGPGNCVQVEVHCPGLQADWTGIASPMFEEGESTATSGSPVNLMTQVPAEVITEVEKQAQ